MRIIADTWQTRPMEVFMRKMVGMALLAGAMMVSACNTVEGVGRDVSSAGNTVAKTADKAK